MSRTLDFSDGHESALAPDAVIEPASQVSVTPSGNLAATDVQAALVELQLDVDTRSTTTATAAGDAATLASAQSYADTKVAALVASSPATLDTLDELAQALGDDPNFATTTATSLGNRLRVDTAAQGLNGTQKTNAKTNIDLHNVDNTSDANKPVSTAQQTALDAKLSKSVATTKGDLFVATSSSTIVRLPVGTNGKVLTADSSKTEGVDWVTPASSPTYTEPKITVYNSGTDAVHFVTGTPLYLEVELVGGGGGGGGGNNNTSGSSGTASILKTSLGTTIVSVPGGGGAACGNTQNSGGAGGAAPTVNSPAVTMLSLEGTNGNAGQTSAAFGLSGKGGDSVYGGGGPSTANAAGISAKANSGSGGSGGSTSAAVNAGHGGGSGAFCRVKIPGPITAGSSYLITVGSAGGGVGAGASGYGSGNGAAGKVIVTEKYQ